MAVYVDGLHYPHREDHDTIAERFVPTVPTDTDKFTLEGLRDQIIELAQNINFNLTDSREKSLALTKLEEVSMWTSKAVFSAAPTMIPNIEANE